MLKFNKNRQTVINGKSRNPLISQGSTAHFPTLINAFFRTHDSLIGPLTADGVLRLTESWELSTFGMAAESVLEKLSANLGEKNVPIGLRITERSANLEYLKTRQRELQAPEQQAAAQDAEPAGARKGPGPALP